MTAERMLSKVSATVGVDPTERFELQSQLGKGSYGTVYKALDKESREHVAIKVVSLDDSGDPEGDLSVVAQEIQMLADCNHPNIVRYKGSYRHGNALWIVMEHCGGGSVSDLIQAAGSGLSEEQVAYVCGEALEGLAYLHNLGKVHRDIKCGNILLTDTGEVKLADFGVAAQLTKTMSKRNTFIGTPHWMAPEVIQESRYDGKVDLWALGISAIEMAEKLPPRWGVHALRVIFMISREPPPQLQEKSKWTPLFHDFIARCLVKDPIARPAARLMLQHRFVAQIRPEARQSLLPVITSAKQSRPPPPSLFLPTGGSAAAADAAAGGTQPSQPQPTEQDGTLHIMGTQLAATRREGAGAAASQSKHKTGTSMMSGQGTVRTSLQFRSRKPSGGGGTSRTPSGVSDALWQASAASRAPSTMSEASGTLVVRDTPSHTSSVAPSPMHHNAPRAADNAFRAALPSPGLRSASASSQSHWSNSNPSATVLVNPGGGGGGGSSFGTLMASAGLFGGGGDDDEEDGEEEEEEEEEGSYMAALRVAAKEKESLGGASARKGSMRAVDAASEPSDYMAALHSAAREATPKGMPANQQAFPSLQAHDGAAGQGSADYMAAVRSAAAEHSGPSAARRPDGSAPPAENWRQIKHSKLIEKLQALHDGGLIPMVPTLAPECIPPLSQLQPLGPPPAVKGFHDMDTLVSCLPEQLQATVALTQSQANASGASQPFSAKQVISSMLQQQPVLAKLAFVLSYQQQSQRLPDSNPAAKDALSKCAQHSCDALAYFLST